MNSHAWMSHAACRGMDLELFVGPDGERQADRDVREPRAKLVCQGCPSRTDCLDYAVGAKVVGVWGGLNDDERASERRRRQRRAAA